MRLPGLRAAVAELHAQRQPVGLRLLPAGLRLLRPGVRLRHVTSHLRRQLQELADHSLQGSVLAVRQASPLVSTIAPAPDAGSKNMKVATPESPPL